jgi:hypothetical protein
MAGAVRQPIDIASLERFISATVPEIKVPIDLKQVRRIAIASTKNMLMKGGI